LLDVLNNIYQINLRLVEKNVQNAMGNYIEKKGVVSVRVDGASANEQRTLCKVINVI
jgi:recombinational DNA repair ATPase RecF